MKGAGVTLGVRFLVDHHANDSERRPCDHIKQSGIELFLDFRMLELSERSFAIQDVRAVQNHRLVRARPEDPSLEVVQFVRERHVIIRLPEPHSEESQIAVRRVVERIVGVVTGFVDVKPVTRDEFGRC